MSAARNLDPANDPAPMRRYTCFVFNAAGEVIKVDATDCADDESALRWADIVAHHPDHNAVELWFGDRFIARRPQP